MELCGIICITEIYESSSPITWFCDTDKIDFTSEEGKVFKNSVESVDDVDFYAPYNFGYQNEIMRSYAVEPPCLVSKQVDIYLG